MKFLLQRAKWGIYRLLTAPPLLTVQLLHPEGRRGGLRERAGDLSRRDALAAAAPARRDPTLVLRGRPRLLLFPPRGPRGALPRARLAALRFEDGRAVSGGGK